MSDTSDQTTTDAEGADAPAEAPLVPTDGAEDAPGDALAPDADKAPPAARRRARKTPAAESPGSEWPEPPRQPETIRVTVSGPASAQEALTPTLQNPPPPVSGLLTLDEIKRRMPYLTAPFPRLLAVVGEDGKEIARYNHPAIATTGAEAGSIEYIDAGYLRRRLDECLGPHWDLEILSQEWESETTVCLHGRLVFGNPKPDPSGGLSWEILLGRESWDSGAFGRRGDGKNRAYALKDAQTGLLRRCCAWMGIGAEHAERDTIGIIAAVDQHRARLFAEEAEAQQSPAQAAPETRADAAAAAEFVSTYTALYAEMCALRDVLGPADNDKLDRAPGFIEANGDYARLVAVLTQMKKRLERTQAAAAGTSDDSGASDGQRAVA